MTEAAAGKRMSFWEHLTELRRRLFRCAFALVVGIAVTWSFREWFLTFLTRPLRIVYRAQGRELVLHYAGPADAFSAYMQMSLVGGLFVASPVILWELWAFISPGLYRHEKRWAIPLVLFASVCFVGGAWFGYQSVLPIGYDYFLSFTGRHGALVVEDVLMMDRVLATTTKLLLAFGLAFELPLVLTILALVGLVDARMLWRFSRWAILIIVVVAALLTPPDVLSLTLMAGPLILLYFLSILLVWLVGRKRGTRAPTATP